MNKKLSQVVSLLPLFLFTIQPGLVLAAQATGFGQVAGNLMQPVNLMADFIYTGCIVIGGSFVFASLIKYIEHRRSPLMVPISTPIALLIAGVILILVPFLSLLTDDVVHFSFFR